MKRWQFWFGVVISAILVYFVGSKLEWDKFWLALQTANYWWILPGVGVYLVGVWVRAWRWHYLLRPLKPVPTRVMFPIVMIGYMGNNLLPARAGEVLRAVVLKRRQGVPISASLATVIVERIFDAVVMMAFIFVNLAELSRLANVSIPILFWEISIQDVALWGSFIFIGALVIFLLAAMFPQRTDKIVTTLINRYVPEQYIPPQIGKRLKRIGRSLIRLLPRRLKSMFPILAKLENEPVPDEEPKPIALRTKTLDVSRRFLDGLESLRSPADALMVFVTSVVIWLLETGKYWFVMHAFGFQVSFFTLMLMNGIVNLATTIPAAPGYVGTFDLPGIETLVVYGVDRAIASGYTLVLHVALWIVPTALGLYYMQREGIKWGENLEKIKDEG